MHIGVRVHDSATVMRTIEATVDNGVEDLLHAYSCVVPLEDVLAALP